ncbi:MAG TPA: hybrid sensor histidine kinase/response regulator [Gemmatimonadales bacterium]|nr:hybrid sensor histidine kinase/response regulator [Gemmatimonadales bacterium]
MEGKARILVIDDEEIVLDSCTEILRGEGYQLATASDGMRGLALVKEFRPDVVVVDLKMPGLSGFDVLARLREADPTVVTVVITGYATVSSAVEAMKSGAYDFLPKPFTPEEFRLIIRRAVEKRSLTFEAMALRRERDLLREHFAAIVSHELKAPLAAIQQNIFVLERQLAATATPDQRERLARVKARMADLIQMVDTWRRGVSIDIEAIKSRQVPVSVRIPIDKAVESALVYATRKAVTIDVAVPEPAPRVMGDQGTLTEALVNLLSNAVKFSRDGGRIEVTAEVRDDEVRIAVTDHGVGIAPDELPHLFEAFYTQPGVGGERGSGLGLAVSRRIVEAHGGAITVQSTPGQGSTFVITLPMLGDDGPGGARREAEPLAASAKDGPR